MSRNLSDHLQSVNTEAQSDLLDRLQEVHPEATSVTLISTPGEYQQMATDAFLAFVERTDVRSHHNDDACSKETPSVSLYFDKD